MQTTGPASPDKPPPAVEPAEAEDKVEEEGAQAKEEDEAAVVKAGGEDEEDEEEEEDGRGGKRQRRRAAGDSAVAMVKRDLLLRCLTCPLCDRLLRKATTISECLHTCESIPALPCLLRGAADPGGLERLRLYDGSVRFSERCPRRRLDSTRASLGLGAACSGFGRPGGAGTWVGAVELRRSR